jgi:peptidyl-prolyl cis-trans isomerase C
MALRLRTLAALVLLAAALGCTGLPFGPTPTATSTSTPPPPTATPVPLAARVNGEGLWLADWEADVRQYEAAQASLGIDLATVPDYRTQVLQALIDRLLLAQAARAAGPPLTGEEIDARLDELAAARGGNEAMGVWLAENEYTVDSFKRSLEVDLLAAHQVAALSSGVGEQAEQVHAAHILVGTRDEAAALRADLTAGADFATLAESYSLDASTRPAGGDLGWFPMGYLLVPEVESAAWALAPGETSDVVESSLGYHIVRVLERGLQPLAPTARLVLQRRAVELWLEAQRAEAQVEIFVSP